MEKAPLAWLHKRIGGSFMRRQDNGYYRLRLSGKQAIAVLEEVLPYFISPNKRAQAILAIELGIGETKASPARQLEIKEELHQLKRR